MVMREGIAAAILLALVSCQHPAPQPDASAMKKPPRCVGIIDVYTDDICEGLFTNDGLPCAVCKEREGCVTDNTDVWCTSTQNCSTATECKRHYDPPSKR